MIDEGEAVKETAGAGALEPPTAAERTDAGTVPTLLATLNANLMVEPASVL